MENFPKFEIIKDKYLPKADKDGFVGVSAFATTELRRQTKSVAGLLDGEEGSEPDYFLGEGLRYKGSSGNYSDMKIHIDNLEEFINRVKNIMSNKIRTRFAPSPTGYLHVGGLRTALYAYLFAKKNGGDFLLKIEDTDRKRFVEGAVEKLINSLDFLGLERNEGVMLSNNKNSQESKNYPGVFEMGEC